MPRYHRCGRRFARRPITCIIFRCRPRMRVAGGQRRDFRSAITDNIIFFPKNCAKYAPSPCAGDTPATPPIPFISKNIAKFFAASRSPHRNRNIRLPFSPIGCRLPIRLYSAGNNTSQGICPLKSFRRARFCKNRIPDRANPPIGLHSRTNPKPRYSHCRKNRTIPSCRANALRRETFRNIRPVFRSYARNTIEIGIAGGRIRNKKPVCETISRHISTFRRNLFDSNVLRHSAILHRSECDNRGNRAL